jgi:sec-independent protein translocase protein TatA
VFDLFQPYHLLIVLLVAFLVFGPKKLPELGAGLGKGIREFKKAMSDITADITKDEPREEIPPKTPSDATPPDRS